MGGDYAKDALRIIAQHHTGIRQVEGRQRPEDAGEKRILSQWKQSFRVPHAGGTACCENDRCNIPHPLNKA